MPQSKTTTYLQRELRRRMDLLKLTARSLSLAADLDESTVKKILSGDSEHPRHDTLEALAGKLGCTVADLIGEVRRIQQSPGSQAAVIAELDVRASAGPGQIVEAETQVGEWHIPAALIKVATNSPVEHIRILSIIGDSMTPTYQPLDRVMVDTLDRRPSPPGIFVLWDGMGVVVKRVEYIAHTDPPRVRISSDNPKYQTYERVLGEAYIQGRVMGKWIWT